MSCFDVDFNELPSLTAINRVCVDLMKYLPTKYIPAEYYPEKYFRIVDVRMISPVDTTVEF